MLTILEMLFLPILGLLVGIVAAMLGIGGGVFIVPALLLLPLSTEFSPTLAAGTSLTMIIFKAMSSTGGYARQKRIDYKMGLILATTTILGAFLGAYLTDIIPSDFLILIFALFLMYVAFRMIFSYNLDNFKLLKRIRTSYLTRTSGWTRRITDSDGEVFEFITDIKLGLFLGFFAGVSSGLLGIGGGSLMVPILHFALSFPIHLAVATSVFIMVFTSISGVATHLYLESIGNFQHIRFDYALLLSVGVIFGAQIGAHISKGVSKENLRRVFGLVLIIVSLRMILKFLGLP
ncbi:MAG: sulfite exporter TauE/SafE family protein [Candidatus Bathyarchaeota archaeon]|nr:MAG: sulfite exporter TauE/SafE family protein [Candidatus Bathyarchaeota archaeon]